MVYSEEYVFILYSEKLIILQVLAVLAVLGVANAGLIGKNDLYFTKIYK